MTENEKKQPKYIFVDAGKNAFKIGVNFIDNPYKLEPFRTLWAKGYMSERRKYNTNKTKHKKVAYAASS